MVLLQVDTSIYCFFFFRFDIKWLRKDLQDPTSIDSKEISNKAKKYLKAIQHTSPIQLAVGPSKQDFEVLRRAYGTFVLL